MALQTLTHQQLIDDRGDLINWTVIDNIEKSIVDSGRGLRRNSTRAEWDAYWQEVADTYQAWERGQS